MNLKVTKENVLKFFSGNGDAIRIISLIIAALAGLWLSSELIMDDKKKPPFHEINWSPKEIIQTLVTDARTKTPLVAENYKKEQKEAFVRTLYWNKPDTTAAAKQKLLEQIDSMHKKIDSSANVIEKKQTKALDKIQEWLNSNSDTLIRAEVSKKTSLFIHTRDLSIDSLSRNKNSIEALIPAYNVTYIDTALVGKQITGEVSLPVKRYTATARFFNKYPGFALWSLLLIIQAIFFSTLIIGFLFHFLSLSDNKLYNTHLEFNPIRTLLLLGCITAFLLILFFTLLNDENGQLVSGQIFMAELHTIFFRVNLLGYIAAAFCLVGMINCVAYMSALKKKIDKVKTSAPANPQNVPVKPELTAADIELLRTEIKRRFNIYFTLTAIILSLAIFTSGIFFSSMNNMEFIKQVTRDQGFSPVNSEMVYIYAVLNSFFLVLIYLPMRFMLSSLDKAIAPANTASEGVQQLGEKEDKGNKESFFTKLSNNLLGLKDIAIAASPILASLLQNLLDVLFK